MNNRKVGGKTKNLEQQKLLNICQKMQQRKIPLILFQQPASVYVNPELTKFTTETRPKASGSSSRFQGGEKR